MSNISLKSNSTAKNVWSILYTLGGIGAAVDSAFVVGSTLLAYFKNTLQNDTGAWVTTLSIVGVYLVIVDWALFKFLPDTLNGILSKTTPTNDYNMNKRIKQFYMGTLIYCVLQTGATVAVTLYLRHDAAHISSAKPDLKDPEAVTRASGEDLRRNVQSIDSDISDLKKERTAAKKTAEYSNKELVQLRDNGNGWAAGEINKKVSKAAAKYDAMIQEKESLKNGFIGTASTTLQTTVSSIAAVNNFKIQDFKINVGAISNLLMFFGIGGTLVQWYAAFMLALMLSGLGIGKSNNNFLGFDSYTPSVSATSIVYTPPSGGGSVYTEPQRHTDGGIYGYIQGFVLVSKKNRYYDPTQFITWLNNASKRNTEKSQIRYDELKKDLVHHIVTEKTLSQTIENFIKKHPQIVGDEVLTAYQNRNKPNPKADNLEIRAYAHEVGHFIIAYARPHVYKANVESIFCKIEKEGTLIKGGSVIINELYKIDDNELGFEKHQITMAMGGFAAEFIKLSKLNVSDFFKSFVLPIKDSIGSDTHRAIQCIKEHQIIEPLETFFYDAVDILNDNLALLDEMTAELEKVKEISDKENILKFAQKVKVYEEVENE